MDSRIKAVVFNEKEHSYWYNGKALRGVTGAIGKILGKNFPDTVTVQIATIYGHDIHKDCEMWIKEGREPFHEGSIWLVDYLKDFREKNKVVAYEAELLVSDFEGTASSIDIVAHFADGSAVLFDIKTTATFHREYCSLQLSVYKKLYEDIYGGNVTAMYVLGTKSKRAYRILPQSEAKVAKILNMNKEQV
jgi:hypothetical protein